MGLVSGIVVFTCIWWVVFFMALPFGVTHQVDQGKGYDPGAPKKPYLLIKVSITTAIAALLWLLFNYIAAG